MPTTGELALGAFGLLLVLLIVLLVVTQLAKPKKPTDPGGPPAGPPQNGSPQKTGGRVSPIQEGPTSTNGGGGSPKKDPSKDPPPTPQVVNVSNARAVIKDWWKTDVFPDTSVWQYIYTTSGAQIPAKALVGNINMGTQQVTSTQEMMMIRFSATAPQNIYYCDLRHKTDILPSLYITDFKVKPTPAWDPACSRQLVLTGKSETFWQAWVARLTSARLHYSLTNTTIRQPPPQGPSNLLVTRLKVPNTAGFKQNYPTSTGAKWSWTVDQLPKENIRVLQVQNPHIVRNVTLNEVTPELVWQFIIRRFMARPIVAPVWRRYVILSSWNSIPDTNILNSPSKGWAWLSHTTDNKTIHNWMRTQALPATHFANSYGAPVARYSVWGKQPLPTNPTTQFSEWNTNTPMFKFFKGGYPGVGRLAWPRMYITLIAQTKKLESSLYWDKFMVPEWESYYITS